MIVNVAYSSKGLWVVLSFALAQSVAAAPQPAANKAGAKAAAASRAAPRRVAIVELEALGLSSDLRRNLDMLLRRSIGTIKSATPISKVDLDIALQDPKNRAVSECGGGPSCAVRVGKLVGADVVVFGTIGALGENFNVSLRALSVSTGKELSRQQASISGSRDLLIPELRLAVYKLIAPEEVRGSLLIEIDVEGVVVEVDGASVGVTPLPRPITNLTPGPHVVLLKREGFSEFQQEFMVRAFETARLKLNFMTAQAQAAKEKALEKQKQNASKDRKKKKRKKRGR